MVNSQPTPEYQKVELGLNIDAYDKPEQLSDVTAWSQLLLTLLYLKPGTYPSLPDMGVDIASYQYSFIEDTVAELSTKIVSQQTTYLPDIPLKGTKISTYNNNGDEILLLQFMFDVSSGTDTTSVAINTSSTNYLDFSITW